MSKDTGGPAFPVSADVAGFQGMAGDISGMTLRQYAAIKLKVPDSGSDWLDEMIVKARRDEFAAKALPGICYMVTHRMHDLGSPVRKGGAAGIVESAYEIADSMLAERSKP